MKIHKNVDVIKSWVEGKNIECRLIVDPDDFLEHLTEKARLKYQKWHAFEEEWINRCDHNWEYRIKPEPKPDGCEREDVRKPVRHADWCASITQLLASLPPQPAPCNCQPPKRKDVQEPVAWMTFTETGDEDDIHYENPEGHLLEGWTYKPLYTHPPKREWVGLTEDEIKECFKITPDQFLTWQIYRRIETKLKEKNT